MNPTQDLPLGDPRYFDNPDAFDPDRRTVEFSEKLSKYAYFPFGGGPRQGVGNYFAMMEIVLVLATVGRRLKPPSPRMR
jgi:cytochrome P450